MTGYLCINFDDGTANQYAVAYSILAAANIPATLYIPSSFVGAANYITEANLVTMQTGGWEIGSHCVTHTNLTTLSIEDATAQLANSKTALEAMGLTITTIAYPFGAYNSTIQAVAAGIYARQRTSSATTNLNLRYYPASIETVGSAAPTTLAAFQANIDYAIATDSLHVLRIHTVENDGTVTGTDYTIQDIAAYIVAKQSSDSLTVVKFNGLTALNNAYIWDGGGADALASNADNWTRDIGGTITNNVAPITNGEVVLNTTSTKSITWDIDAATATVYKITMDTGYSGTFTQASTANIGVGKGGFLAKAGTITGNATKYLKTSGNVTISGATITANLTRIEVLADGVTITGFTTPKELKATASVIIASAMTIRTALSVATGKTVTVNSGTTLSLQNYNAGYAYSNLGRIITLGTGYFRMMINASMSFNPGDVGNILFEKTNAANNYVITFATHQSFRGYVTVSSLNATATLTLDFNGQNINIDGNVTAGARGVIIGGEGVHHIGGNFDSSAGTWTPETCQVVFTKAATLKTGADQPLYDMLIAPDVAVTLASDVTVSHTYGNGGTLIPGAFALTASGSSYDKVFLPTEIRANISPLLYPTGKRFMRRLERVQ